MIISAKYGVPGKYLDVTKKVNELPKVFYANNENFTDPAPGVVKHIIVEIQNGVHKLYIEGAKIDKDVLLNKIAPIETSQMMMHYSNAVKGKKGLEINGPHKVLSGLKLYESADSLDNLVYDGNNLLNNEKKEYKFYGKTIPGYEYYGDVLNMNMISDASYDFVFVPYVLEHLVNPLKALKEITRILKPNGICFLVFPWRKETGDHKRNVTNFDELVQHYNDNRDETDVRDHLNELVNNYDLTRDPKIHTVEQLVDNAMNNNEKRALHIHVFDSELINKCLQYFNYKVIDTQLVYPYHQIVVAKLDK